MKKEFKAPKLQVKKIEAQSILAESGASGAKSGVTFKVLTVDDNNNSIM